MPAAKKPVRKSATTPSRPKPGAAAGTRAAAEPILKTDDVQKLLLDLALRMAQADVANLVGHERMLRAKLRQLDAKKLRLLRDQLDVAMTCLRDHVAGSCPQVPYFTICLLAAAVFYFADRLDLIPDFLPRIGRLDDAVVMALAFRMGESGIRRYCDAVGRSTKDVFPARTARA